MDSNSHCEYFPSGRHDYWCDIGGCKWAWNRDQGIKEGIRLKQEAEKARLQMEYDVGFEAGIDLRAEQFAVLAKAWADSKERIKKLEAVLRKIAEGDHPDEAPEIAAEALNEED